MIRSRLQQRLDVMEAALRELLASCPGPWFTVDYDQDSLAAVLDRACEGLCRRLPKDVADRITTKINAAAELLTPEPSVWRTQDRRLPGRAHMFVGAAKRSACGQATLVQGQGQWVESTELNAACKLCLVQEGAR